MGDTGENEPKRVNSRLLLVLGYLYFGSGVEFASPSQPLFRRAIVERIAYYCGERGLMVSRSRCWCDKMLVEDLEKNGDRYLWAFCEDDRSWLFCGLWSCLSMEHDGRASVMVSHVPGIMPVYKWMTEIWVLCGSE